MIHGQPNSWTCGPFALRHALLALGVFAPEDDLSRIAGSTEERGTDEDGLKRAAGAYRTELVLLREASPVRARRELEAWVGRNIPVLLCVDQWEHWLTVVAVDAQHVVLFDSKYDAPLRTEPWEPLLARLACRRPYMRGLWTRTIYDLHPIVPRNGRGFRLALDAARARHLLREENTPLARRWDEYARALLPLALPPSAQLELGFDLEQFVAARRGAILDLAAPEGGDVIRARAARVVDGLAFVAGLYRAVLHPEVEPEAVMRLAEIARELVAGEAEPPTAGQAIAAA